MFDTETRAYQKLSTLQGVVVPVCYGRVSYGGRRSLLLQHTTGQPIDEPAGLLFTLQELSELLRPCLAALNSCGITLGDEQLNNFLLVDDNRLIAFDSKHVEFDLSAEDQAFFLECAIISSCRYTNVQAAYRADGFLETA